MSFYGALSLVFWLVFTGSSLLMTRGWKKTALFRPGAIIWEGLEEDSQKATDSLTFSPAGEGSGWLRMGEAQYTGGWKAVLVKAGSPGGEKEGAAAPEKVSVAVRGMTGDREIRDVVSFELLPMPLLESDREEVEFSEGSEDPAEIKVFIKNPGTDQWEFEAGFDTGRDVIADVAVRPEGKASALLTLNRAGAETGPGPVGYRRSVLRVTARQRDLALEKELNVLLAAEGIEIAHRTYPDRQFRLPADGRALPALIGVYAPGMGEKFSRTFRLGLETTDITPGSRAWEEEVRRTEEFIGRFIPVENRPDFMRILETRKHTLGVDGLFEVRRRIWSAAQDIMLARGKSYEIEAEWQEYYLSIANWTKWLGDQAFAISRSGGDGGIDSGSGDSGGGKTGGRDAPGGGSDMGSAEGRTGDAGENRGKESRDSREKWEQDARERREKWEKEAGDRREQWRRDAEDRRKK